MLLASILERTTGSRSFCLTTTGDYILALETGMFAFNPATEELTPITEETFPEHSLRSQIPIGAFRLHGILGSHQESHSWCAAAKGSHMQTLRTAKEDLALRVIPASLHRSGSQELQQVQVLLESCTGPLSEIVVLQAPSTPRALAWSWELWGMGSCGRWP